MADSRRKWTVVLPLAVAVTTAYLGLGAFLIGLGGGWWAVALVPLAAIAAWFNQIFRVVGKPLAPRMFGILLAGLAILQVVTFIVPLVVVPRWMPAIALDGTDPQRTGCADIGDTVGSAGWTVYDSRDGAPLATAQLRYSTACDTTWVKLEGVTPSTRTLTQVTRPAGDWLLAAAPRPEDDSPSEGIAYSMQIRSNGCTHVNVTLLNGDDVIAELHESNGCDE